MRTVPVGRLPARCRSSAPSTPWSAALRTMWVSGSERPSIRLLSSPTSLPRIFEPGCPSSSRAPCRVQPAGTWPARCRFGLHAGVHDGVLQLGGDQVDALEARLHAPAGVWPRTARSWLRLSTSSPAKFIRDSSSSTLTRRVPSPANEGSLSSSSATAGTLGAGRGSSLGAAGVSGIAGIVIVTAVKSRGGGGGGT